jgi:tetratricopeptide (TPR) repeat protein
MLIFNPVKHLFTLDHPFTGIFLISLWALVSFYPVLNNDFSLDDTYYLEQVDHVHAWKDVWSVTQQQFSYVDYRPLPSLTFAVEKVLSGGAIQPGISHGINLLLYILGAILFYLFLLRLQELTKSGNIALITSLLFISLPLHTSMVGNIKSRDGLISFALGFIYLYSLLFLFSARKNMLRLLAGIIAMLAIIGAIYSKLDGFNFLFATPFLFLLLNQKIQWKLLLRVSFIGIITYRFFRILFTEWMARRNEVIISNTTEGPPMLNDPVFFTENPIVAYHDWPTRLAFGIQTIFEYVLMVFKPAGHYFYYGFDMVKVLPLSSPVIWMKAAVLLIAGFVAIWLFIKREKLTAFGIVFFFLSLMYCSNLITPVAGIVADRYAYIASAGACIALAGLISWIGKKTASRYPVPASALEPVVKDTKPAKKTYKTGKKSQSPVKWWQQPDKWAFTFTAFICLFYLPFNISRSKEWKNYFTLFEADMPKISHKSYEANRIAIRNYVETAIDSDDPDFRQQYFTKALEYGINAITLYDSGQYVHDGMILALRGLNQFDACLAKAREVIERFDSSEVAWRVMTDYYYYKKYLDSAAYGYRKLIDIVPNDPNVYFFYVTALQENGKMNEGLAFCDSLIAANRASYIPYQAKSYLYLNARDSANAVIQIEKGFEMGWRDNKMLDIVGMYWWTRDMKKWEEMKKYLN